MVILQVEHGVRAYDTWKAAFDRDPVGREAGGVRSYRIMRAADDENRVVIELEFDAPAAAEAFREKLRQMWASAGAELGLEDPSARILEVVETLDY